MMRELLPNALWWFRWGAMFTFLTGWTIVLMHMVTGTGSMPYYAMILTGGTLGTFMWYNVWFVIMPRQRLAIASAEAVAAGGQANPEAAKQAPIGGRASRTNTLFSIPMLFFMGAARHLSVVDSETPNYGVYLSCCPRGALEGTSSAARATRSRSPPSAAHHPGLGLTLVLFVVAAILLRRAVTRRDDSR
jgi:uncharacterized membrane protein